MKVSIITPCYNAAAFIETTILIENYSYFMCSECDKKHQIFGESKIDTVAAEYHLQVLAKLPIDPSLARACDNGQVEEIELKEINQVANQVEKFCK